MRASQKTWELRNRLDARTSAVISFEDAEVLRRAELTLHRWYELECGDSNRFASFAIEREENGDGKPFMVVHNYPNGHLPASTRRYPVPDRENGAIRRVKAVCEANGLHPYFQTDPRGCSLYVSSEPLDMTNYTNGVSCSV